MTSWRHLKTFSLDYGEGLGRIVDFEAGLSLIFRACIFMPSRVRENGAMPWEVCNTMKPDDFDALADDYLFKEIVA